MSDNNDHIHFRISEVYLSAISAWSFASPEIITILLSFHARKMFRYNHEQSLSAVSTGSIPVDAIYVCAVFNASSDELHSKIKIEKYHSQSGMEL